MLPAQGLRFEANHGLGLVEENSGVALQRNTCAVLHPAVRAPSSARAAGADIEWVGQLQPHRDGQAFNGTWVAIPPHDGGQRGAGATPAIDMPFTEAYIQPMTLIGFALSRRSGIEVTRVYGHAERAHREWVEAGKPERVFRGTLREGWNALRYATAPTSGRRLRHSGLLEPTRREPKRARMLDALIIVRMELGVLRRG